MGAGLMEAADLFRGHDAALEQTTLIRAWEMSLPADRKSPALTEYVELEGRDHWTCAAPGWEAVADRALEWALEHARVRTP